MAGKGPMSIWWPLGFLIGWVICAAIGGGLLGAGYNSAYFVCDDFGDCDEFYNAGLVNGGIALLAISGVLGLIFWVLLIVWLIKRSHHRSGPSNIVYTNQAGPPPVQAQPETGYNNAYQQPHPQSPQQQQQQQHNSGYYEQPQQPGYGQQAAYAQQPGYGQQAPYAGQPNTREVPQSEISSPGNHPISPAPESQGTAQTSQCASCGHAVNGPFCAQCGNKA